MSAILRDLLAHCNADVCMIILAYVRPGENALASIAFSGKVLSYLYLDFSSDTCSMGYSKVIQNEDNTFDAECWCTDIFGNMRRLPGVSNIISHIGRGKTVPIGLHTTLGYELESEIDRLVETRIMRKK